MSQKSKDLKIEDLNTQVKKGTVSANLLKSIKSKGINTLSDIRRQGELNNKEGLGTFSKNKNQAGCFSYSGNIFGPLFQQIIH